MGAISAPIAHFTKMALVTPTCRFPPSFIDQYHDAPNGSNSCSAETTCREHRTVDRHLHPRSHAMRYLISFDDGSMDHITAEDLPAVGEAVRIVVRDAKAAGIWVFGAGLYRKQASYVSTDGTVTPGPFPETKAVLGGFSIIDVPTHDEALAWAAKFAVACRCTQEVREIGDDPES
jgi:hypothetical protein